MRAAILLLSFGEPEEPTPASVGPYLERIFLANARLDRSPGPGAARERVRAMAAARVGALVEDYRRIGGSPLNEQVAQQAALLEEALTGEGHDVVVLAGMKFTEPGIPLAVDRARAGGADRIIALPAYPVRGPSTTVAALAEVRAALDAAGWAVPVDEVADWHAHPAYVSLRADGVRDLCVRDGVDLADPETRLVFSAHGTPLQYLDEGSRYDVHVADHCRLLAEALEVERYVLGYQNHGNRPGVAWTEPEIEAAVRDVRDARRIVVVPVSFVQENSETLVELDLELKAVAEAMGLGFHRVPIAYDDARFVQFLADLVGPRLGS